MTNTSLDPSTLDWPVDEDGQRKIITGPVGQHDDEYGRTYEKPGDPDTVYAGVTGVIGDTTDKKHIPKWAAAVTAEAAIANVGKVIEIMGATPLFDDDGNFTGFSEGTEDGREAALKFLKGESARLRELASEIGRHQHDILEALILDSEIPAVPDHLINVEVDGERVDHDEISDGFLAFIEDFEPEFLMAEATVVNTLHETAGTLDAMAIVRKLAKLLEALTGTYKAEPIVVIDAKTGKHLYEKAIREQLNEYGLSDEVWVDKLGKTMPMPEVDGLFVLHIRKDFYRGYKLKFVEWDSKAHERFMYRREVIRGGHNDTKFSGQVVYPPLPDGSQPAPLVEDVPAFGRCRKALIKAGFLWMSDFEAQTQVDLLTIKGVGPAALRAIEEQVIAKNLPEIVRASDEELLSLKKITKKDLAEIRGYKCLCAEELDGEHSPGCPFADEMAEVA